jgi:hypothetical protein
MPNDLLVLPTFHGWNKQYRHREIKDIDDLLCKLSRASFLQGYFFFLLPFVKGSLGISVTREVPVLCLAGDS